MADDCPPGGEGDASRNGVCIASGRRRSAIADAQPLLGRAHAPRSRPHRLAPDGRREAAPARTIESPWHDRGNVFSVVIATPDVVGERMAGPGIRAWHLAEELKKHFPTQLMAHGSWSRDAMRSASVLIGQPARGFHRMKKGQRIIYDLFDPVLLELREMYGRHPSLRQRLHFFAEQIRLRRALSEGDLFIIATPHQRELYPNRPMIEVPFGTDAAEWSAADLGDDRENLIIWGGGTWEWLDPRTAVDAVVRV